MKLKFWIVVLLVGWASSAHAQLFVTSYDGSTYQIVKGAPRLVTSGGFGFFESNRYDSAPQDADGTTYWIRNSIVDTAYHAEVIRVRLDGTLSVLAQLPNGVYDGALQRDAAGNFYAVSMDEGIVSKITPAGETTTLADLSPIGYQWSNLALGPGGLYAMTYSGQVAKILLTGGGWEYLDISDTFPELRPGFHYETYSYVGFYGDLELGDDGNLYAAHEDGPIIRINTQQPAATLFSPGRKPYGAWSLVKGWQGVFYSVDRGCRIVRHLSGQATLFADLTSVGLYGCDNLIMDNGYLVAVAENGAVARVNSRGRITVLTDRLPAGAGFLGMSGDSVSPEDALANLFYSIARLNLPQGIANSLLTKVSNAYIAVWLHGQGGAVFGACGELRSVINETRALSGKKIPAGTANQIILETEATADLLGCRRVGLW